MKIHKKGKYIVCIKLLKVIFSYRIKDYVDGKESEKEVKTTRFKGRP